MSTGHLTPETVAGWRERRLAPRERLDAVRHLGGCASCRELVRSPDGIDRLETALQAGDEHPRYHDLEALVDGEADTVAHDLLITHLAECQVCAQEFRDLSAFRGERAAAKPRPIRWALPVGAVAALALVAIFAVRTPKNAGPATIPLRTSLQDAGMTIGLDASGSFQGLDNIPEQDRAVLRDVLQSGKLPVSAEAAKLKRTREVRLDGAPEPPPTFEAAGPTGTVVPEENPRFHWDAPSGARNFVVSVYTMYFEPVMKSRVLTTNEWTPDQNLSDGRTYVWTVSAEIEGKRVTVPRAPDPEALFRVATAAEREQLAAAKAVAPGCSLLEATVAARLGMLDVARQALAKLEAANPGSPLVASLSQQLLH